jgi:hypothetical protein
MTEGALTALQDMSRTAVRSAAVSRGHMLCTGFASVAKSGSYYPNNLASICCCWLFSILSHSRPP